MINITIKLLRKQVKIVKWLYVEGIRTDFLIDSNQPYQQVLQERDAVTGTLLAHYTYGHDLLAQHNPTYGPAYYHYDAQLSTRHFTLIHLYTFKSEATNYISANSVYILNTNQEAYIEEETL